MKFDVVCPSKILFTVLVVDSCYYTTHDFPVSLCILDQGRKIPESLFCLCMFVLISSFDWLSWHKCPFGCVCSRFFIDSCFFFPDDCFRWAKYVFLDSSPNHVSTVNRKLDPNPSCWPEPRRILSHYVLWNPLVLKFRPTTESWDPRVILSTPWKLSYL